MSHTHTDMDPTTQAFFAHLKLLRAAAHDADDDNREEAQLLLIDLYEQMLERTGVVTFRRGETEH